MAPRAELKKHRHSHPAIRRRRKWSRRFRLVFYILLMLQIVLFSALSTLVILLSSLPPSSPAEDELSLLEEEEHTTSSNQSFRQYEQTAIDTHARSSKLGEEDGQSSITKIIKEEDVTTVPPPRTTSILHSWRSSFLNNTELLLNLKTTKSCRGKEELLSILYAASATKSLKSRDLKPIKTGHQRPNRNNRKPTTANSRNKKYQPSISQYDMKNKCPKLPDWKQVTDMYGKEAVVLGLDTCAAYRQRLAAENITQPKVRIAGNFNSGTTALSQALHLNFPGMDRNLGTNFKGNYVEFDVPWGKHVPPKYKWLNKHPINNPESPKYAFPVVIVRDPYRWMNSMCKESYDAVWDREENHCPNLVRDVTDPEGVRTGGMYPLHVAYEQTRHNFTDWHASVSDYWSDWIRNYYDSDEPRLFVRFEDLLFHAEDLMYKIAQCVGLEGNFTSPYKYVTMPSKRHGKSSDFFDSLTKYGHEIGNLNMTEDDLEYARSWTPSSRHGLDAELMATFHYRHPGDKDPPNIT